MRTEWVIVLGIALIVFGVYLYKTKGPQADPVVQTEHLEKINPNQVNWKAKDDDYWKEHLGPLQYKVCRQGGTERPFTGKHLEEKRSGVFHCSSCALELFSSETKFDSGTGWPSFYAPFSQENIKEKTDRSFGMTRTEVLCPRCGAHLGHVFKDGPKPTGLRYCINSVCLDFHESGQ